MYIIEFLQTSKKLSRGGVLVGGIHVSVYRVNKRIATPDQATAGPRKARISELLGERFFQGDDCGVRLKADAGNISIRIPDLPPRRKGESDGKDHSQE